MSIKLKVKAAAAALTLLGGVASAGALTATTAWAATPSCGLNCMNIYPRVYSGQSLKAPQFVLDVLRQGEKVGQPVILFRASNTDLAEDFTIPWQGPASSFYAAGLLSSALALHYGCEIGTAPFEFPSCAAAVDDQAFQIEYSPYGVLSGLCVGVGSTAVAGTKVALEPCGVSSKTTWIQDTNPGDNPLPPGYFAAINGSETNYSNPYVLDYPNGAYPTDRPRVQLETDNLTGFSAGVNNDNEMWTGFPGVLP
jgi:hypothetical protein